MQRINALDFSGSKHQYPEADKTAFNNCESIGVATYSENAVKYINYFERDNELRDAYHNIREIARLDDAALFGKGGRLHVMDRYVLTHTRDLADTVRAQMSSYDITCPPHPR